jgi:hypothetical protein
MSTIMAFSVRRSMFGVRRRVLNVGGWRLGFGVLAGGVLTFNVRGYEVLHRA